MQLIAAAQDLTTALVQPTAPFIAGSQCRIWLYCMNSSASPVTHTFERSLTCVITTTYGSSNAVLILNSDSGGDSATIAPNSFAKREYLLTTTVTENRATVSTDNYNPVTLVIQDKGATNLPAFSPSDASDSEPPARQKSGPHPVEQFLTRRLSTYEPIYFIVGSYPAAEFQFSLKYQLFAFTNEQNFAENAADHFYFGFTQTSFWDLISRDPKFYDSSYKPSLFFYYTNLLESPATNTFHLHLQSGAEHESNGKGDTGERSIYTAYLQPTLDFNLPENFSFFLQPRARTYFLVGPNNTDIADYRGYAELQTGLTWTQPKDDGEKVQLALKYQIGQAGRHAGYKVDLRFNLAGVHFLSAFKPTIQLQYFTGYGQSFLQYNESSRSYRAGLCLWFF